MIDIKIKKELTANLKNWLSKMNFSKKNIRVKNINNISNQFINELKTNCSKLYGIKSKKRKSKLVKKSKKRKKRKSKSVKKKLVK